MDKCPSPPDSLSTPFGQTSKRALTLYGRKLQSYGDAMVTTDEMYLAELAKLNEIRAEGGTPTRSLKDKILSLRSTCEGLFGEETLGPLALDFNLPRDRDVRGVLRQAEIIRDRIKSSEKELVSERWVSGSLDRESAARELDPEIEARLPHLTAKRRAGT